VDEQPKRGYVDDAPAAPETLPDDAFEPPRTTRAEPVDVVELAEPRSIPVAKVVDPTAYDGVEPARERELAAVAAATAKKASVGLGALLIGIAASLLPETWRRRLGKHLPVVSGTFITGLAQLTAGAMLYAHGVMQTRLRSVLEIQAAGNIPSAFAGLDSYLTLLFSLYGLLCLYLFIEGLLRLLGAAVVGQPHCVLPLWVVQQLYEAARDRVVDARLGKRTVDVVTISPGDCDLRIESSRPRDWDSDTATIDASSTDCAVAPPGQSYGAFTTTLRTSCYPSATVRATMRRRHERIQQARRTYSTRPHHRHRRGHRRGDHRRK